MKASPKAVGRTAIEECIRCMALEAIIGTPPIGIVEGLGFSDRTVEVVAAISIGLTSKSEMALGIAVTLGWVALGLALVLGRSGQYL